jgi:glycosyltransferase involved in cell wall biosynthesis
MVVRVPCPLEGRNAVPTVSVCIPVYNMAGYLSETIESVLRQDYGDYELVVSDDASTDGTLEVCSRYTDPRIRLAQFEQRAGQAGNWNRCVEMAAGELIVLLHADDILVPSFLSQAVQFLRDHPEAGMVHCAVQHFKDQQTLELQQLHDADQVDPGDDFFRRLLTSGCVVNPAGVMVRKKTFVAVGKFTDSIAWGIDWHMWLRIALHTSVGYLHETLAWYRAHDQSGTAGVMATGRYAKDELWALDDIFSQLPADRPHLRNLYAAARFRVAHRAWCHAEAQYYLGHTRAAGAGVRQAVRIAPSMLFQARTWGLLTATYLGNSWFERLRSWKKKIVARAVRR